MEVIATPVLVESRKGFFVERVSGLCERFVAKPREREGARSGAREGRERVLRRGLRVGGWERVVVLLVEELELEGVAVRAGTQRLGGREAAGTGIFRFREGLGGLRGKFVFRIGFLHVHCLPLDDVRTAPDHRIHAGRRLEQYEAEAAAVALVVVVHHARTVDLAERGKIGL